jgi:hypothetical protein
MGSVRHQQPAVLMWGALGLAMAAIPLVAGQDSGQPDCGTGSFFCDLEASGIYVGSFEQGSALAQEFPDASAIRDGDPSSWYEYRVIIACEGNYPDDPSETACAAALAACTALDPDAPGPHHWIFRRVVTADGSVSTWSRYGHTCFPAAVPTRSGEEPGLTEAMIVEQFHRTDFALPQVVLQPSDNRALVNLPVFFELAWPEAGFEPMEVDTTVLVGREVRIRPTLQDATYIFGDGSSHGPTSSLGGPYPDGDVTHTYTAASTVNPSIEVTYGGEVSVDGADWTVIPASVTIAGPAVPLEVLTSRNRLYDS